MTIEVDFWQLVTLLLSFLGFVFGGGKLLLHQIDKRLDGRFQAMETARAESSRHWETQFSTVIEQNQREAEGWKRLEREFLELRADLPLHYVRREDYIRGQSVIEAKLDAVYSRIELVHIQRGQA